MLDYEGNIETKFHDILYSEERMHKIGLSTTNPKSLEIAQTISMLSTESLATESNVSIPSSVC